MGVAKATVGDSVVDRHVLHIAFVGLSRSLDTPDHAFFLFLTFERRLAIAETPRTRDFTIFVMTPITKMTMTMQPITLPFRACARGNKLPGACVLLQFRMSD